MKGYNYQDKEIVIAGALRSPIGQVNKSLAGYHSYQLGTKVAEEMIGQYKVDKSKINGVIAAEIGQSSKAPNVARVMSVNLGLPLEIPAITVANNCVSSYEAAAEACRRIALGEGDVQLVIGVEMMSKFPLYLDGARQNSKFNNPDKATQNAAELANTDDVKIVDGIIEGLNDPVRNTSMIETGEIAAQNYGFTQEQLDEVARQSYKKAYDAIEAGKYDKYVMKMDINGKEFSKDEYIMSKASFVSKPERFAKASPVFEHPAMGGLKGFYEKFKDFISRPYEEGVRGAVTLFNACPQSDGAGALIMTTKEKAQELGLSVLAKVTTYAMHGIDPVNMGIGMAYAGKDALDKAGLSLDDIGFIEMHEAFAATALGSIYEMTDKLGLNMRERFEKGDINRNGGTLALGHPLGMTGIRVLINQLMEFEYDKDAKYSLGTICAGGGVAGSFILERP